MGISKAESLVTELPTQLTFCLDSFMSNAINNLPLTTLASPIP